MQTSLNDNSTFFDRILQIANNQGYKNINDFAKNGLGYSSSQKLNRLKDPETKPSLDIIEDISNKFEGINLDWMIFGRGAMLTDVHADTGENLRAKTPAYSDIEGKTGIVNDQDIQYLTKEAHTAMKPQKLGNYASDRIQNEITKGFERQITDLKADLANAYMADG